MRLESFTFNPFQENTYLLIGQKKSCIIIDPGMMDRAEEERLFGHISQHGLEPIMLINTHCHIDHVLGNHAVHRKYGLSPIHHRGDIPVFQSAPAVAQMYGLPYTEGPTAERFIEDMLEIDLDGESLEWRFVPGHAPGHIILIDHGAKQVIAGDTLFAGSIGRTDLPGGDHELLLLSIRDEMYSLDDDYIVWPGHGPKTRIGVEKRSNPFVSAESPGADP